MPARGDDALDWFAGDPDQIAAYAQTWRNVAANTTDMAGDLRDAAVRQVAEWSGSAADAYRGLLTEQLAMNALARAAGGIGGIVEGAGLLVALVREMVRDLIADFISVLAVRLPMWLAEEGLTLGLATPLVVSQVGSLVAKWAAKISQLVMALLDSLRRLKPLLTNLGVLIDELRDLLRRLSRTDGTSAPASSGPDGRPGTPADIDPMGRRSHWTDPAAHPQAPSRPPDSYLPAGDPIYHRPNSTAIGYDSATMNNFDMVAPEPGYHDVVVHGEPNGLFRPGLVGADGANYPADFTHPNQIADAIRNNPHYDGGPVRLVSCHTGTVDPDAGVPTPAQQVADALGVPVTAPTNAVGVNIREQAPQVPRVRGGGTWVTFYLGGGQ